MLAYSLISYFVAILVGVAVVVGLTLYFKKTNAKFSVLSGIFGFLWFAITLVTQIFIMLYAFSVERTDFMSAIMDKWVYKMGVVFLFVTVFAIIRYVIAYNVFYNRYKKDSGTSFLVGYGVAPVIAVALYCAFMFVNIIAIALGNKFVGLDANSTLVFENNSIVSVFTPFSVHIFVALALACFALFFVIYSACMQKQSMYPFGAKKTFITYLVLYFIELIMYMLFVFLTKRMLLIFILFAILGALAFVFVKLYYNYKEPVSYDKQFEV